MEEIQATESSFDIFVRGLKKAQIDLKYYRLKLSDLKQKQAVVVNEAESVVNSLCSGLNFFSFSNSFLVIAVKSTITCISLLLSALVSLFLLSTLVCPVCLAFLRMKEVFLDFTELQKTQLKLIEVLEIPFTLESMELSGLPASLFSSSLETHLKEVKSTLEQVKSMSGSLYGNIYRRGLFSVCGSLILYVATIFWMAKWEKCESLPE